MESIRNGLSVKNLETRRLRKDGTTVDVAITISPIMDDEGNFIGASSIARNITATKAEELLRTTEEQYQSVVENIAVGVYRSTGDPRGKFLWGSPALVRILGYPTLGSLEEVEVADLFVDPDGRAKLLSELRQEGFVRNREIHIRRADGTVIIVLVTALAKPGHDGNIEYISGLVEDVTQTRKAEKEIGVMKKEIFDILEFLPDPAFIVDNNKTVVAWNRAIEVLTGVPGREIIGKGGVQPCLPLLWRGPTGAH